MASRFPEARTVIGIVTAAALALAISGCGTRKNEAARPDPSAPPAPAGYSADGREYARSWGQRLPEAWETPGASPVPTPMPTPASDPEEALEPEPTPGQGPGQGEKIAYLTFDDGPSGNTEAILDVLHRKQVKATFFVTGKESEASKTLYRRMAEEGHKLGNHTYSHDYVKLYRNPDAFMEDVHKLDRLLEETVGYRPDILRFPGGSNTRLGRRKGQPWMMPALVKRVREEGYQYFDWNVTSTDAAQAVQPKADILASVKSLARNKDRIIVLMHDVTTKKTTVEALPEIIRELRTMGFRFATLDKQSFTTQFLR